MAVTAIPNDVQVTTLPKLLSKGKPKKRTKKKSKTKDPWKSA